VAIRYEGNSLEFR